MSPTLALVLAALAAAAVVATTTRRRYSTWEPRPLHNKPAAASYSSRFTTAAAQAAQLPPAIPANVLAVAAAQLVRNMPYESHTTALLEIATGDPRTAEASRSEIVELAWKAIALGVDGLPISNPTAGHNNAIAAFVQNTADGHDRTPETLRTFENRGALTVAGRDLLFRYYQLVEGVSCLDDWERMWFEGHTKQEVLAYHANRLAVGSSPAECMSNEDVRTDRARAIVAAVESDPTFTAWDAETELSRLVYTLGRWKTLAWPAAPAVSPSVDWVWVLGALARMYAAAQTGNVKGIADVATEAGRKSIEWTKNPPDGSAGTSALADSLANYAAELAASW